MHARCAADIICTLPFNTPDISSEWRMTTCVHWQAIGQAGSGFVKFFAGIDRKAEDAGLFPKLTPSPVPEEVIDSDGSVDSAVDDVRPLSGGTSHCQTLSHLGPCDVASDVTLTYTGCACAHWAVASQQPC